MDLPKGGFGSGYSFWRIPLYRGFVRFGQRLYSVRVESHDKVMLKRAKTILVREYLTIFLITFNEFVVAGNRDWLRKKMKLIK